MSLSQRRARSGRAGTPRRRGKGPGALGMLKRGAGMLGRGRARAPGGVRRRRGITATELRGFNKVSGMLGRWGMAPRKMRGARLKTKRR